MTRFIKTLIIINGILIPFVFIVFLLFFIKESIRDNRYSGNETGVLTKNVVQHDSEFVAKQGLDYSSPRLIDGTENYFIAISVKNLEKPQALDKKINSISSSKLGNDGTNYLNIIFLDKNYNVIRSLLNKKASITDLFRAEKDESLKTDNTVKNIAYNIVFEDTNHDGKLDNKDLADLYISGIDGNNLTQITKNIDIQSVDFYNKNTMLFIEYKDRKNEPEEYKDLKFASYNILENKLRMLDGIDKEMTKIKGILNKK